ncbi:putative MFS family arabinose efflux permease [Paenibacillus taihuensis]|uniref:Putative MFS family arabinose efflux permease n=1 Tax=Paenibacillus taihuensis TaxID=1156355 RepID=A0A3D9QVG7_9BACL|nr:MFS transporter [Paenibacillus taihuensis]REE68097.1 putative MFS family arabinose efflux permease [Paenibacillus taihuensis]
MKRTLLIVLLMSIGATYISSLFPVYGEHFKLSSLEITILFAIYAAVLLPTLLIVGSRGGYWGLKKVLRISIWLSIASTLLFIASTHVWMLYVARILEGIAYGAFTGAVSAFLLKQTTPEKTGTALKLSGVTVNLGFGLGPAVSGLIVQYLHVQPLRMPFWILLFMLFVSLVLLELLPKHEDSNAKKNKISLGIPHNVRNQFWSIIGLPIFTVFTLGGVVLSLIPTFVKNVIHTSNLSISGLLILLLLGGGALMQFFPWPKNPVTRIRLSILALTIGSWLIFLSGQTSSMPLLWAGFFIQGIGAGWTFQAALRFAGQLPKPEERPRVISAFYMCAYAGFIAPPVAVGVLTSFLSLNTSLVIINMFAALIVVYVLIYSLQFKRYYSKLTSQ